MKQIAQNYKSGELAVLDAPAPACRPGGVLVQSLFSLISTGTEMMKVAEAKLSMVGKARARPDQVRKVLDTVAQQGAVATYKKVMNRLDSYTPLGYSLCGVVIEVGQGPRNSRSASWSRRRATSTRCTPSTTGSRSTCAPPVPRGVSPEHAAFSTVGAIAMHGVRRAEVQLGETACVIGLGLVGQLVVRLLVASGVRVIGLDVIEDRCRLAEQAGAVLCAAPGPTKAWLPSQASLDEITSGRGADHVFLAAGGSSNAPVETAARLARDRARVVDIGKTRLDLPWTAYYDKELDVRFSRSYGPGRYDDRYELEGIDYPAGYVRWTERRNLECFLDLLARKEIEVETLVSGVFPMENASTVYADLSSGSLKAVGVLLEYPAPARGQPAAGPATSMVRPSGHGPQAPRGPERRQGWRSASSAPATTPRRCCCRTWSGCRTPTWRTSRPPGRCRRSTPSGGSASPPPRPTPTPCSRTTSLDAIFIVTRHHTHADLVCRALETGKAVFVEKPLALTGEEVDRIVEVIAKTGNDRLMVGFNRRFAPLLTKMKAALRPGQLERGDPLPGQRGPAGRGQLVPRTRSWRVAVHRRRRSLHRHAELVGGQPARGGLRRWRPRERRRPGHRAVRERLQRRHHLCSPAATRAFPKETLDAAAAAAARGSTTSGRPRSGPGAATTRIAGPRRPGQGAARRAGAVSSRPAWPARPCRSRSSRWSPRPGRPSRWGTAC